MFNLVRGAFLTRTMVRKSRNIDFGAEIKDSWCFFDFWDSNFPNSFWKNRSHMAPQGKWLCGKESHMDPLHFRFSSKSDENVGFYQSDSTFSWWPCFLRSSVWDQFRQVFVFPARLLFFQSYWKKVNILFGAFLVIYMSNKFPNPSRKLDPKKILEIGN